METVREYKLIIRGKQKLLDQKKFFSKLAKTIVESDKRFTYVFVTEVTEKDDQC